MYMTQTSCNGKHVGSTSVCQMYYLLVVIFAQLPESIFIELVTNKYQLIC